MKQIEEVCAKRDELMDQLAKLRLELSRIHGRYPVKVRLKQDKNTGSVSSRPIEEYYAPKDLSTYRAHQTLIDDIEPKINELDRKAQRLRFDIGLKRLDEVLTMDLSWTHAMRETFINVKSSIKEKTWIAETPGGDAVHITGSLESIGTMLPDENMDNMEAIFLFGPTVPTEENKKKFPGVWVMQHRKTEHIPGSLLVSSPPGAERNGIAGELTKDEKDLATSRMKALLMKLQALELPNSADGNR